MRKKQQERELEEGIEGINGDRNNKIFHGKRLIEPENHRKREILNQRNLKKEIWPKNLSNFVSLTIPTPLTLNTEKI